MTSNLPPLNLSKIVHKVKEPCIVRNFGVPWKCLGSNLNEFCEIFDEINPDGVVFEKASQRHGSPPQWESFREKTSKMTLKTFLEFCSSENEKKSWLSYGYKSLRELPGKIQEDIDFAPLGFPEIKDDITLWLGSRGSHTSCHYDTYGRNIVVQVFGHKRWILFSPEVDLEATRIPYEESSVYSSLNFFSPRDLTEFAGIKKLSHIVTLSPGDVLVVPPRWWHFVENLDTALALNAWIPIEQDTDAQISECFTKGLVVQFLRNVDPVLRKFLLNPNEMDAFDEDPAKFIEQHLKVLNYLRNVKSTTKASDVKKSTSEEAWTDLSSTSSIETVRRANEEEFHGIIIKNMNRFDGSWRISQLSDQQQFSIDQLTEFINSLCNAEAIDKMKHRYLGAKAIGSSKDS